MLVGLPPAGLAAQCSVTACHGTNDTADYVVSFGVNALIGGVSSGLLGLSNGGNFLDGLWRGSIGGGVVFAGKAVAGRSFAGSGLAGRQIAGVGNSIVANAALNRPILSQLTLHLGPIPGRLFINTTGGFRVRPVVDLVTAGAFVYGAFSAHLDWSESWSHGAAVFRESPNAFPRTTIAVQPQRFIRGATTIGGTIFVTDRGEEFYDELVRHETIHVLQFDAFVGALGDRADTWLFDNYPEFDRIVKTNWLAGLMGAVNQTMFALSDRSRLPWEVEARLFSGN